MQLHICSHIYAVGLNALLLPQAKAATLEQQLQHADAVILQLLTESLCKGGPQLTGPPSPVGFSAEQLLPRLQHLAAQAGRDSSSSVATSPETPSAQLPGAASNSSQSYYRHSSMLQ